MISVSTLGLNNNHPNLYMYDQCKYSKCVGVNTNHTNLYMYDQCKYSGSLHVISVSVVCGCKHQPPKPLHV